MLLLFVASNHLVRVKSYRFVTTCFGQWPCCLTDLKTGSDFIGEMVFRGFNFTKSNSLDVHLVFM